MAEVARRRLRLKSGGAQMLLEIVTTCPTNDNAGLAARV
jgi:hypothetical protein